MIRPKALVVADICQGQISPVAKDALALAGLLCPKEQVAVVVPGADEKEATALLKSFGDIGGIGVIALAGRHLLERIGDDWLNALTSLCQNLDPEFVVCGWSSFFMEVAPGLAAKLNAACITGVDGFENSANGPVFSRLLAGGAYCARVAPQKKPWVICVSPGAFAQKEPDQVKAVPGKVQQVEAARPPNRVRAIERMAPDTGQSALDTARVVVAAGRGVGSPENMEVIFATAALFGRSAVAGSRPVCDAGWLPVSAQVGVTGRTISPALYLACGISGAFQHIAAISGARCVVAINCDGRAPIFSRADFGIVECLEEFLPAFMEICQKK